MIFLCHLLAFSAPSLTLAKRHWNSKSSLSIDEQRRALLDEFLERNTVEPEVYACRQEPDKVSRVPTQSEIDEILKPLRPQAIREIASHYNRGSGLFIFLRTHYGPRVSEEDRSLNAWRRDDGLGLPCISDFHRWWQVLDDAEHFNLWSDWRRVYNILPDLAVPTKNREAETSEEMPFEEDVLAYDFMFDQYLAYLATGAVMIIFDEEFFETDKAGLVFRDPKGDIVRAGRIAKAELGTLDTSMTIKANLDEQECWNGCITGDKYRSMITEQ